ncbi:hypothetical protein [Methylobacterium sp. SyP6R]|uniref:hypothetical protein n=1 Tax=Methylobacterium sp. SyP6R TaxID=2718876 RepID=UPI001F3BED15|nr:hypothetical protein [Methylobacterium sp. SyP6R]MCF4129309.1 hypothetical protein [Methylobacterium sp. SyP6R]
MGLDVFESIRATRPSSECDWLEQSFVANLGDVIQSVGAMNAREGLTPVDGASSPRDWDALIAHVRKAACDPAVPSGPGGSELQARHREAQAQALLRSAHKRLDEAAEREARAEARVRAAEDRARAAEARAAATIEAAESRARRAEEAARSALDWLQRLRQAGLTEAGAGQAPPPELRLRRVA